MDAEEKCLTNVLSEENLNQFKENGYTVIPDFLSDEDVLSLKNAIRRIVDEMDLEKLPKCVFSTNEEQDRGDYFLNSGDKVRFFFEQEVLDDSGQLMVDKHLALNKIGHALHWLVPEFRKISFSDSVKTIAKQVGFKSPALVQSMYIFKHPEVGGEVAPHKDSTFLSTEPQSCIGLWLAIEDASVENGCLWFNPGSQKTPTNRRYIRNPDSKTSQAMFTAPPDPDDPANYVAAPVRKAMLPVSHKVS